MLQEANIPVIWGLKLPVDRKTANQISTIDLLKYLTSQAIRANKNIHNDAALAPRMGAYAEAKTEEEWMAILLSVLQGIPLLYIILDMEILSRSAQGPAQDFWPGAFLHLFEELSRRSKRTVVRVALVSAGSPPSNKPFSKEYQDLVVDVKDTSRARILGTRQNVQTQTDTTDRRSFHLQAIGGNQRTRSRTKRLARRQ